MEGCTVARAGQFAARAGLSLSSCGPTIYGPGTMSAGISANLPWCSPAGCWLPLEDITQLSAIVLGKLDSEQLMQRAEFRRIRDAVVAVSPGPFDRGLNGGNPPVSDYMSAWRGTK